MSLYYDAASIIEDRYSENDSLKLTVFAAAKKLRSPVTQLFALLSGTLSWNNVLSEIIQRAGILEQERKLTPELSLVLVHDLLFSRKGISAPASHPLRVSTERHRTRLQAELTKFRVKKGCISVEALRTSLSTEGATANQPNGGSPGRPRWVRINTLKTSLDEQLKTTFQDFEHVDSLEIILKASLADVSPRILHIDENIPDLVAIPMGIDIVGWKEYHDGKLILQDKASCFPAYLLDPTLEDCVIDACAAPGNKTTHIAALLALHQPHQEPRIWACERDKTRAGLLQQMVSTAGADRLVVVRDGQDFLKLQPNATAGPEARWAHATALLLDPSCSGSGMIGRDEAVEWKLPTRTGDATQKQNSKKRKRADAVRPLSIEENELMVGADDSGLKKRLQSLAAFQLKLLLHSLSFPKAQKITYSTCSIHEEENELVVLAALASPVAKERGWKILPRAHQVEGMRKWHLRGKGIAFEGIENVRDVAESCIRCSKATMDGTQGFFVAIFQRDSPQTEKKPRQQLNMTGTRSNSGAEDEWAGFSDSSD